MAYIKGIYLLLGTNLGDRAANLRTACDRLQELGISIVRSSPVYETEPWGISDQPSFYNTVLQVATPLDVYGLLDRCLETERQMGRQRVIRWGERIIDVDILYYGEEVIHTPDLTVPHPGIAVRRFTLLPLCDLCPNEVHPVLGQSNRTLLDTCPDTLACDRVSKSLSSCPG